MEKRDQRMRSRGLMAMIVTAIVLLVGGQATADKTLQDDWYGMELAGIQVGWSHSLVTVKGDELHSQMDMEMSLKRGLSEVSLAMNTTWVETVAGKPVSVALSQDMSMMKNVASWTFTPEGIKIVETSGGQPVTRLVPLPEEKWLTPYAAFQYFIKRVEAGDKKIEVVTMSPEVGPKPVKMV